MHEYTVDWTPDALTWYVDGVALRTKFRNETYNATTGQYHYPQSPSRVQLSLWPAGLQSNGAGTIAWAGGLVDWDSSLMTNGYYYAQVSDVVSYRQNLLGGTMLMNNRACNVITRLLAT